jgi:hypothetical protein
LRLRRRWLREVFLEERLESQHGNEGEQEDEKQAFLVAGFLLRVLIFGQSL